MNSIGQTMVEKNNIQCNDIPDLHCFIVASRGDASPIGRPCHGLYPTGVTMVGLNLVMGMTIAYLPYLYRFVIAGRGDATAIGRPRQGIDPIRMASIGEVMFHCNSRGPKVFHLPHLYQLIVAPTGDEVAIW